MNISLIIFVGAVLYMSEKKVDRNLLIALAAGGGLLFLMSRNQDTLPETSSSVSWFRDTFDEVCGSDGGIFDTKTGRRNSTIIGSILMSGLI